MRYLADLLTLMRLVLAFVVPGCILQGQWMLALVLFSAAALSDALDGWCARRWPYSPEEETRMPWRRIDHHLLDNGPDTLMMVLAAGALVFTVNYWWMLALLIYGVGALFFTAVTILIRKGRVRAAEVVDVVFGGWFVVNIGMVLVELAHQAHLLLPTLMIGLAMLLAVLRFKWERVVSRPETRAAAMKYAK